MSVVSRQFGRAMIVVAGLLLAACDELPTSPEPSAGPTERAVTLGDWTRSGYASSTCRDALDEIAALGANRVVFLANAYQETATSSRLERDGSATDLNAFRTATTWAGQRDLLPILKLHVDVRDGTWRGEVDPADRDAWFDDYRAFVVDCAVAAAETDVATLVIGTELARLSREEFAWREIIAETRAVYDGEVLYAASWDEVERVPFWDALDAVGVDFTAPWPRARTPPGSRSWRAGSRGWSGWIACAVRWGRTSFSRSSVTPAATAPAWNRRTTNRAPSPMHRSRPISTRPR